jgi:membrane protein implicated in regulation of membrane protease activity
MAWWLWIVLGAALLAAELFVIDAQFYLVFLGSAAIIVGFADVAGLGGPHWVEWLAFAALSVALLVAFRERLRARLRPAGGGFGDALVGETGVAREALAPGARGSAELRGTLDGAQRGRGDDSAGARLVVERSRRRAARPPSRLGRSRGRFGSDRRPPWWCSWSS